MFRILIGIFISLHGLVHWLYLGQSRRFFEMQPGMTWPDGAWAFTWLLGVGGTRWLAAIATGIAGLAFTAGGLGYLFRASWSQPVVTAAAGFSALLYFLLWDGSPHHLDRQGALAILIDLALLGWALLVNRPPAAS